MRNIFWNRLKRPAALVLWALFIMPAVVPAQEGSASSGSGQEALAEDGVPLTLREALALAMDNNLNIAVRRYEPAVSDAAILSERSFFEPSLNGFAQYRETTNPTADPFLQGAAIRNDNTRFAEVRYDDPTAIGGLLSVSLNGSRFATNSAQFLLNPVFQSALTITYDQSLLRNFGYDVNKAGIRIAQRNRSISESQFRQAVIETLQNVEKAYWDLKFTLEDLKVKRHSLRLSEETKSQNQIRVDVGTMAPIDVTTAEAEVASRRQDVLVAENSLENARDMLLLYLNQPKTSPLWMLPVNPVDEPQFDGEMTIDLEAAIVEAYDNRPDLEQTQYQLDNDEDQVMRARNAMRWDLTARAQYGKVGLTGRRPELTSQAIPQLVITDYNPADPNDFTLAVVELNTPAAPGLDDDLLDAIKQNFDEDYDNWLLSLNLSIPLGNKQAKANYLTTRLRQEQRREILDSQELDAVIQVRNSARSVLNTIERVKASRVNVRLQQERLSAENKRYDNGMTTTFELFQFQDDLTRAQSQVNLALVDYNKALADLEASKGTLARSRGVHVAELMAQGRAEVELP